MPERRCRESAQLWLCCHETSEPLPAAADGRMAQPPWLPGVESAGAAVVSRIFLRGNSKGFSALNGLNCASTLQAPTYSRPVLAGAGFVVGTATTGRSRSTGCFCGRPDRGVISVDQESVTGSNCWTLPTAMTNPPRQAASLPARSDSSPSTNPECGQIDKASPYASTRSLQRRSRWLAGSNEEKA